MRMSVCFFSFSFSFFFFLFSFFFDQTNFNFLFFSFLFSKDGHPNVTGPKRIIEKVGSATTLVTEKYLNLSPSLLTGSPNLRQLLMGPIVVDTINFDPAKFKVTPKDVEIALRLWRVEKGKDGNGEGAFEKGEKEEIGQLFRTLLVFFFFFPFSFSFFFVAEFLWL